MRLVLLAATALSIAAPAQADDNRLDTLERQLSQQQERIRQLEALVARQSALLERMEASTPVAQPAPVASAAPAPPVPAPTTPPGTETATATLGLPGLDVSGDVRVRQEWNAGGPRGRSRSVLRARLQASYALSDHLSIGTRIVTGDPDDPNTADLTLSNFVDDLTVSLDQAYIRYQRDGWMVQAGKFANPFARTDMVWDGDVAPQGAALAYTLKPGAAQVDARALYFVIDEAPTARDSDMLGGQIALATPLGSGVRVDLAGGYYHYRLGSVAGADAGDFRGNRIAAGRYLSDFRLLNALGSVRFDGFAERWPVTIAADYVRNLGAKLPGDGGDTGFSVELAAGQSARPGDWRLGYTYSEVGVDAVFAAFSHDNLDLSTNYRLHALGIAHVPAPNLLIDLAYYHYRPLDPAFAGGLNPADWLDRLRINLMVSF